MTFLQLKWAHLTALILWAGPALGGYYFLWKAYKNKDPQTIQFAEKTLGPILWLEHAAFVVLLLTGISLFVKGGYTMAEEWLQTKLMLITFVTLFELLDCIIHHYLAPKYLLAPTGPMENGHQLVNRWRKVLMILSIPTALIILFIIYIAVNRA